MTFKIPLFKVLMSAQAKELVGDVLASGHIAQGKVVDKFEAHLGIALSADADRVVTVNSGTSALHLAYHLADVHPGDVVIVTPMTCAATITPLVHMGAEVVWADVDTEDGNISIRSVENLIDIYMDPRRQKAGGGPLKAVVAVDWAGTPANYSAIRSVLPMSIPIIEDAAHAFRAKRNGETPIAGPRAVAENVWVCHSFQAIKHLTTGDGGALVLPTKELADRARKLRWFGLDRTSSKDFRGAQDITEAGYKFHMNDIAAAIGLANMDLAIDAVWFAREHAKVYDDAFTKAPFVPRVISPVLDPGSSYWVYTLLVEDRDSFQRYMTEQGIQTSQVHRRNDEHPAFPFRSPVSLSGLDHFAKHQVAIPVGWWMTDQSLEYVIDAVRAWAQV